MTDAEITQHLAEKVMGWSSGHASRERIGTYPRLDWYQFEAAPLLHIDKATVRRWNPLESIADAFEVQAALLPTARSRYAHEIYDQYCAEEQTEYCDPTVYALCVNPRQRCLAMVEATR